MSLFAEVILFLGGISYTGYKTSSIIETHATGCVAET